jgi:hypothetical protein
VVSVTNPYGHILGILDRVKSMVSLIVDTLSILHREKKGVLMNTLEQFHIHKLTKENLQLNDTYKDTYNPIFDLIIKHNK